jgi:hypothetical protein
MSSTVDTATATGRVRAADDSPAGGP